MIRPSVISVSIGRMVGAACLCGALILVLCWHHYDVENLTETKIDREIADLRVLGFSANDEALQLLDRRKPSVACQGCDGEEKEKSSRLASLYQTMLASYLRDLREFEKLGISQKASLVHFVNRRVIQLREWLAVLERRQAATGLNADSTGLTRRMKGLVCEYEQLVAHCKGELRMCTARGMAHEAPRVAMLKERIRHGVRMIVDLERSLGAR